MNRTRHGIAALSLIIAGGVMVSAVMLSGKPPENPKLTLATHKLFKPGAVVPIPDSPLAACFAEGTDPAIVEAFMQFAADLGWPDGQNPPPDDGGEGGAAYYLGGRWSGTTGDPRALTWSLVPDGLNIPNGIGEGAANSTLFASMDTKFAAQGGRATWVQRITECFARWQQLSGVTYTRVTFGGNDWDDGAAWGTGGSAGLRGDIRISAKPIDGGSGVLAYNSYPSGGGDMVLDEDENWGQGSGATNKNRFMRNIVSHEHGHGLGIDHVCPANGTKLMEPFLSTSFDGPRHDDIRAVERYYGDPFEIDDTSGGANDIGALTSGVPVTLGDAPPPLTLTNDTNAAALCMSVNSEFDWFRFTVAAAGTVTVSINPIGLTYDSSVQNANGSCASGTNIDSKAQRDLNVEVIDTNGTTVLGTGNSAPAGSTETLSNVSLPVSGNYYFRVSGATTTAQSQLYKATITFTATSCTAPSITTHPNSQAVCSGGSVTFTVAASGTAPLSYQWRKNSSNIGGATSTSYTINPVGTGDAGNYDCVVTNACGSATSNAATLTVNTAPSITVHPSSQTKCVGEGVTFSVTAGGSAPLSYQWRFNSVNIPGATNFSHTINPVNGTHAGNYDVVVTNSCGSATSNIAVLTVNTAPSITAHPSNQTVNAGDPASFSVTAGGTGPLSYQWRKNTVNLSNGGTISGATTATLSINPTVVGDAGSYDCVVTNACGSATSNAATLTVNAAPCDPCDTNCDGSVNPFDINSFLDLLGDTPSPCSACAGDANSDGTTNPFDINAFLVCMNP